MVRLIKTAIKHLPFRVSLVSRRLKTFCGFRAPARAVY